tara:strand:+ start:35253 stop:35993 length:741 start_codon:yes stop_codon:yes gene_type:complete
MPGRDAGLDKQHPELGIKRFAWQTVASGVTAVWANDNTRGQIFDAMQRKETFATTGPRIRVGFFGGFDFSEEDAHSRQIAALGHGKGVPMGGDFSIAPQGRAPTFLVAAMKDPQGGNLDSIQVVRGWLDNQGKAREKIYNVAWGDADNRALDSDGNLPPVGNTVDVKSATWMNTIGDVELPGPRLQRVLRGCQSGRTTIAGRAGSKTVPHQSSRLKSPTGDCSKAAGHRLRWSLGARDLACCGGSS